LSPPLDYDLDVDHHKQQQNQSQPSSGVAAGQIGAGGPSVGSVQALSAGGIAAAGETFVVLYDYAAQRGDEIQLVAGQLVQVLDTLERDWWKVRALDGSNRIGYFPSSYLAQLYQNERPLQVAQTIQVSNGETCDKLLRGQVKYCAANMHKQLELGRAAIMCFAGQRQTNLTISRLFGPSCR
jgi:hypothetical protein